MLVEALHQLIERQHLSENAVESMLHELVSSSQPEVLAAVLVLLRAKGETAAEIQGIVKAMRNLMVKVETRHPVLDIVGTGGDNANTVNISTASAIVAASCGVKVAKHGNRSVSSLCGAADVLEAFGIPLLKSPSQVAECIDKAGIGFMFAPYFHPAMQRIAPVRRSLKVQTIFNLLGPLLNPAGAKHLVIGVFQANLVPRMAKVLSGHGLSKAIVFHGQGIDELSTLGASDYLEVSGSSIKPGTLCPEKLGFKLCELKDLRGGSASQNCNILTEILKGKHGPISDTLALNAGVSLYTYGSATTIQDGVDIAKESLKQGRPYQTLEKWRELCKQF